jgi:hypothetical protein
MTISKRKPFWEEYGLEPWPGRYFVWAEVEGYRHEDSSYKVSMIMSMKDSVDYAELEEILAYSQCRNRGFSYYHASLKELTFSQQQADDLVAYLNSFECFNAWKELAFTPAAYDKFLENDPTKYGDYKRTFYQEEGYPLDFKVIGSYNVGEFNRIGLSQEAIFKRKIKNTIKWFFIAEREKVLQMMLDLIQDNIDRSGE